jgi:hypothetical protein
MDAFDQQRVSELRQEIASLQRDNGVKRCRRMCGCVRDCVQKGAKYALVVGDKVYTLNTSDKAALDELNKLWPAPKPH